jgi:hypothetical protein
MIAFDSVRFIVIFKAFLERTVFSVVYRSEFLSTDPEVPGSIPGSTKSSE